jgi:NADH-quinone oxidoreductase subunit N
MTADATAGFVALAPSLALLGAAVVVLVVDWWRVDGSGIRSASLALAGVAVAAALLVRLWPSSPAVAVAQPSAAPVGEVQVWLLRVDGLARFGSLTVLLAAAAAIALSWRYTERRRFQQSEFFALTLLAAGAMIAVTTAVDLITMFLLVETFSVALYVLAGYARGERSSLEAALKYFVLGSVAAGFFLYGAALVYGASGSVNLSVVHDLLAQPASVPTPMLSVGFALLVVGLGFKLAVVPFHLWTPDVYEGAPLPITAFMAAATKAAALVALVRVLWTGFGLTAAAWSDAIAALAVATMLVGNLAALVQSDMKRMLAYSSVAQAGVLLAALVAGPPDGIAAAAYYLVVYAAATLGAFAVIAAIGPQGPSAREAAALDDLRGLARRHAPLALALALFLVSLVGLPPTAGFVGKWYVFAALLDDGRSFLAVAVVLNSALAALYYLRPVLYMVASPPASDEPVDVTTPAAVVVGCAAVVVALAIVLTGPLVDAARLAGAAGSFPTAATESEGPAPPGLIFTVPTFEKRAP